MNTKAKRVFLTFCLSISLIFSTVVGSYAYTNILAFGDSLSDNGIYQGYPGGMPGNSNPNDVYGFYRFSNGPVWVEYLAQNLGVPLFDMAYGGATTSMDNPYAYTKTGNAAYQTTTGLQWQVATYSGTFNTISDNTLITVWAGANDMFNARNPLTAAQNIALAVQNLITLGGDSFLIPNLTISNPWVAAFDPALAAAVAGLRLANPGVDFYELNMNAFVRTGIDNPTGNWIANSCANTNNAPGCMNGVFLSWDGIHPTTEIHAQIAAYAATNVPEPASIIFLISGLAGLVGIRRRMK